MRIYISFDTTDFKISRITMSKKTRKKQATGVHSFLEFQNEVKRKEIEEVEQLITKLEAKNQELVKLRDQLREEQQQTFRVLYDQTKEQEKQLEEKQLVNEEQVEQAIQHNLELKRIQDEELAELNRKLVSVQEQVMERQVYLEQQRQLYESVDSAELQQRIQNLESELVANEKKFQAMSEHIERSHKAEISEIDENMSKLLEEEMQVASKKSLKQVDRHKCPEIKRRNEWLKREIAVYQEEISVLEADVKNLEEENLELVKELLECRLHNVQISSNAFLTQGPDLEHKLSLPGKAAEIGKEQHQQSGELEKDEMDHSCKPSSSTHHPKTLQCSSQSNPREPLHLDPLEQRMLCVVGQAMPLYPLPSDSEDLDTTHLGLFQAQDETLATKMIRKQFQ
ncbi:coiled-coil domain-containing protein 83 [Hemibagrus wyckioides]|uniref:coiled-coil domain-containing protein 83 n=1 Tax=Hemibagrus wyckioides TaxID=337641 RepID=UPI00266D7824|nr:coiled-coil domain-containing protein 83 [Hemibagrus wyckioides]